MLHTKEKAKLDELLSLVRRRIFQRTFIAHIVHYSLAALPLAAVWIACSRRWSGLASGVEMGVWVILGVIVAALFSAWHSMAGKREAALELDANAGLKDRIASALQFIEEARDSEAHALQIRDAIAHAGRVHAREALPVRLPGSSLLLPLALAVFFLSFLTPPGLQPQIATNAESAVKRLQLAELRRLREALLEEGRDEDLARTVERLRALERQFVDGKLGERDLMLELGRLNERMEKTTHDAGVGLLEAELNAMVPHLMAAEPTAPVARAIEKDQLDEAAEELEKLAEKMEQQRLTPEEKNDLQTSLGAGADELGQKLDKSFGPDLAKASEALGKSDDKSFSAACSSMGEKLRLCRKVRLLKAASRKVGDCKTALGQPDSDKAGEALAARTSDQDNNSVGDASSDKPVGERDRLSESYRNLLRVSGMAGDGPVETETEILEGQVSVSQVRIQEIHASFSEIAEEAIENEIIPRSRRRHVKRYFQTIRPAEE